MQKDSISMGVVDAVARDKGVAPTDLPPLYETIDPEALERVVETGSSKSAVLWVEFEYAERIVTIEGTTVSVRRRE